MLLSSSNIPGITLFLSNLTWINILLSLGIIFFERKDPRSTLLWIMVVNFLPIFGFLAYLYLGVDINKSAHFRKKEKHEAALRAEQLAKSTPWPRDHEFLQRPWIRPYEGMIHMHHVSAKSLYSDNNRVQLFFDGEELFQQIAYDLSRATHSIEVQFYIFKSDELGSALLEILERKAREGVKVKILIDGMGGRFFSREWKKRMVKAGVELAVFFPATLPLVNVRFNYRNHRKIVVIDHKIGYLGGFNVGNEYLSLSKRMGYWRDTHLRIEGNAVNCLAERFYYDFAFASDYHTHIDMPSFYKPQPDAGDVAMNIVTSGPDSIWPSIRNGYAEMIQTAKKRIYIQTPYFTPDTGIINSLKIAALTGCDVRIMIPNKPDHIFVYWASLSHLGELLDAGVRGFTYERGFLHSKVVLVDDVLSSIGTANFDERSFQLNFEVNSFIYDKDINEQVANQFHEDMKYCREITLESYAKRSRFIKVKESVSRLFSPIL